MKLLRTARTLVLALLVLVPALLILPASNAHARDVDGFGPHGYTLDTRSGIAELGQYHLGDLIVYCIDLNSLGPRSASGWTSESPGAVARQVGFGGERGRPGDLRGAVISEQTWAEIAWVLDYTSDKRSHDWAAATDHVIRTRTAGDQAQQQRVDDRFRALSAKHPQAVQHVQTLEKLLTEQAGPYRIDLSWVEEPSLDEAGTARVRVLGAKGNPLPYPVTVTVDGDPVPLPAGVTEHLVEVPAGVGQHRLDAQAKVPAAKPVLYRATHHANAQHTDAKVQRMVGVAPRQELNAQLEASVVARQPSVDTTTTAAEIEAGEELADQVTVTGADPDDQLAIAILYGPYLERPTSEQCRPEDEFARVEFTVTGETPVTTPAVRPTAAGYYTWVIEIDESTTQLAHRTACGIAEETTLVSEPEPEPEPDPTPEPTPEPDPTPEPSPAAPKPEPQPQTLRIRAGGPVPMSVFGPVSGGAALVLLGAAAGEIWQRRRRR